MSLFDGLEDEGRREPVKRERTQAHGGCPHCSADKVGLVRSPDGSHLTWKIHNLTTHAGTSLTCSASAQHLCDAPARDVRTITGIDTPHCPHGVRS